MESKDLEKIVKIILDNAPDKSIGEATRLIIELIKAVEKPPEVRIVHDYTPYPNYINDQNKLTWIGDSPIRYEPTCMTETAKNTHWEQPCSTTATNDSKVEMDKSLSDILYTLDEIKRAEKFIKDIAEMNKEEQMKNKRGFAK